LELVFSGICHLSTTGGTIAAGTTGAASLASGCNGIRRRLAQNNGTASPELTGRHQFLGILRATVRTLNLLIFFKNQFFKLSFTLVAKKFIYRHIISS
jgi:hypothetical protein